MRSFILSFSVPHNDLWIVDELDNLKGSRSAHIVQAIKDYLANCGIDVASGEQPPYWYVPGKDYSTLLPLKERLELVRFGYEDEEVRKSVATDTYAGINRTSTMASNMDSTPRE